MRLVRSLQLSIVLLGQGLDLRGVLRGGMLERQFVVVARFDQSGCQGILLLLGYRLPRLQIIRKFRVLDLQRPNLAFMLGIRLPGLTLKIATGRLGLCRVLLSQSIDLSRVLGGGVFEGLLMILSRFDERGCQRVLFLLRCRLAGMQ